MKYTNSDFVFENDDALSTNIYNFNFVSYDRKLDILGCNHIINNGIVRIIQDMSDFIDHLWYTMTKSVPISA